MDTLKNKRFEKFEYLSRYSTVPYYYDTVKCRDISGIGSQMSKQASTIIHTVVPEDTLDSLALKYYNNPTFWWVIAYFNNIIDPFAKLITQYKTLKIPSITSIAFHNERS